MILPSQTQSVHFIGIGGAGMGPLAEICLRRGLRVSGSDRARTPQTERLAKLGAAIHEGHEAAHIAGADLVVFSSAIARDNPELLAARHNDVAIWHRSEMLAAVLHAGESIAITGTHGKTTVSAMTALVLDAAGVDPTAIIGGTVPKFGSNARIGGGKLVVAECDESDGSFLRYHAKHALITNIEADHLENYGSLEAIEQAFEQFVRQMQSDGWLVISADDRGTRALLKKLDVPYITYGLFPRLADVRARAIELLPTGSTFTAEWRGRQLGQIRLAVPGLHNVSNALGVLALTRALGIDFDVIAGALAEFRGVRRRFEIKGTRGGVTIVDDYAHHPTEVAATLSAASSGRHGRAHGRVISVFQPHRYSRTQALGVEFGSAFSQADEVVVTDIYAAGELPIEGISGRTIYDSIMRVGHPRVTFLPTSYEVEQHLLNTVRQGDMVLTLGAGDIWRVGEHLLAALPAS